VKIDFDGRIIGESPHPVNPTGFIVHSAIHAARPDAHAVAHTHTTVKGYNVAAPQWAGSLQCTRKELDLAKFRSVDPE
jgi:Class II Aldolase and Adducin N-terminal domain